LVVFVIKLQKIKISFEFKIFYKIKYFLYYLIKTL
jgi:hypothetical protein